jgi:predicted acyltransferase
LRFPGVLQRIALVYFATSLIVLHAGVIAQAGIAAVLLLGYWGLLHWLPNPHDPAANLTPAGNVVRVVDQAVIGSNHLYTQGKTEKTDPEGLLSTLPAIATALIGYMCGLAIQSGGANWGTVRLLLTLGAVYACVGLGWDYLFPIGKKLWTSSFVMLTGGLGMMGLAACLALFDVAGWRKLARPFEIVGVNAIFVFVGSGLLARLLGTIPVKPASEGAATALGWVYQTAFAGPIGTYVSSDPRLASLAMALATVAFWWIILWLMARRGWSVRV